MAKFCSNCGKELDEKAIVCVECGAPIVNKTVKGLSSLILGLIGCYFILSGYVGLDTAYANPSYALSNAGFAFGYILIPIICGIIGLALGLKYRKAEANNSNLFGIISSAIAIIGSIIIFIIML